MAIRFVVEPVDVDGDGVPDGDLVKKYDGNRLISQKFVPNKKMQKIADKVVEEIRASGANASAGKREKIVYKKTAAVRNPEQKPVMVADATGFGQYIKAGAGLEVGQAAVGLVFDGLADLF